MNYNEVKELISIFVDTDLTKMELQMDNVDISLSRGAAGQAGQPAFPANVPCPPPAPPVPSVPSPAAFSAPGGSAVTVMEKTTGTVQTVQASLSGQAVQETGAAESAPTGEAEGTVITAPLVGTFYSSPAPDQPSFVKVGDTVSEGDVVCIIEAMKFMNEVNSDVSGKVAEILVEDGELVEFGKPLIRIV